MLPPLHPKSALAGKGGGTHLPPWVWRDPVVLLAWGMGAGLGRGVLSPGGEEEG